MQDQYSCDDCSQICESSQALFFHISQKHMMENNLNKIHNDQVVHYTVKL